MTARLLRAFDKITRNRGKGDTLALLTNGPSDPHKLYEKYCQILQFTPLLRAQELSSAFDGFVRDLSIYSVMAPTTSKEHSYL